jgi:hypothetical protein
MFVLVTLLEAKPGQYAHFTYCDDTTYMDLLVILEGKSCHQSSPEATTIAYECFVSDKGDHKLYRST